MKWPSCIMGRIVEQAGINELFDNPKHPYTQGLLHSIPHIDEEKLSPACTPLMASCPIRMRYQAAVLSATAVPALYRESATVPCRTWPRPAQSIASVVSCTLTQRRI